MKTTGSEFKKFIDDNDYWSRYLYYDDYYSFTVNGVEIDSTFDKVTLADDAVVKIKSGVIKDPTSQEYKVCSLDHFFRKWKTKNAKG